MADVVKLVNTLDCGSSISWVRVPSFAPFENKCQRQADIFFLLIISVCPVAFLNDLQGIFLSVILPCFYGDLLQDLVVVKEV